MLSKTTSALAVDALALAIIKAVKDRGRFEHYTLQVLHTDYGGPRLQYAGNVLRHHHDELVMRILQDCFKFSDSLIFEAVGNIDLDALVYVPRDGTKAAHIKIQAWPPTRVEVYE